MRSPRLVSSLILLLVIAPSNRLVNAVNSNWENIEQQTLVQLDPNANNFIPTSKTKSNNDQENGKKKKRSQKRAKGRKPKSGKAHREEADIYSQNIHGLFESKKDEQGKPIKGERTYIKLEYLVNKMRRDNIDVYLLQETWDEGDWTKIVDGYTIFHHNNMEKKSRTGVAIILSPKFSEAWKRAGGLDPLKNTRGGMFEGRFIGVKLKFPLVSDTGRQVKGKWQNVFVSSVYHPYDDTYSEFNTVLDTMLSKVSRDYDTIIGGDINANIGRGDCEELEDVMGPYGLDGRNEKGRDLLQTYQTNDLCVMNTVFPHPNHVTFVSFNEEKTKCMLDIIAVSRSIIKKILSCNVVDDGVRSDHSAVRMRLAMYSIKVKDNKVAGGRTNYRKLLFDTKTNEGYNSIFMDKWDNTTSYEDFNALMIEAAGEAATSPMRVDKSWFEYNKEILMPLIDERNALLHQTRVSGLPPDEMEERKKKLRELQRYIYDQSRIAYGKYAQELAEKISNLNFNPHVGWISVYTLAEGESGHHKKPKTMAFRKSDGNLAQNDEENMEVLEPHFMKVLNMKREVKFETLNRIPQYCPQSRT